MYKNGGYAGDDRMCDLVCDRYAVLQVMSRFGIALGFGDKTIAEVCAESRVDAATFLAVVNMLMNFGNGAELAGEVSVRSLTDYLHNSHGYFLDFRLPAIRRKLIEAVDCALSDVSFAIMRFFDEYSYEEIAAKLSLPLGTVKTQIHRAREQMCRLIAQGDER